MLVYVRNKDGSPLMPCKPAKAKHLLKAGKAKVFKLKPFTIQLLWDCEATVQSVTCGIDKGAKQTGIACIGTGGFVTPDNQTGKVLFAANIKHRSNVKEKMTQRRECRRQRRARLWYRKKRFNNRASSRRKDRLPPTIETNINEVIRVVERIPLPISAIIVEDVMVDIRRLSDKDLKKSQYQKSNRLDENLRLATLTRDGFTCQCCHAKNVQLHAHHIVWRECDGKDSIYNLITVCEKCHSKIHKKGKSGKVRKKGGEVLTGMSGKLDQIGQLAMQGKMRMYRELSKISPVSLVFGYQTAEFRKKNGFSKEHFLDAVCVACLFKDEVVSPSTLVIAVSSRCLGHQQSPPPKPACDNLYFITFRPRQVRQKYHVLPQKGKGRVLYQRNESLSGFQKGDIVLVKGFIKQVNSIYSTGTLAFPRVKGEPYASVPKNCRLLEKNKTINYWNTEI
jgi:5-methylcytosine-specific restriction endonuclease McrA